MFLCVLFLALLLSDVRQAVVAAAIMRSLIGKTKPPRIGDHVVTGRTDSQLAEEMVNVLTEVRTMTDQRREFSLIRRRDFPFLPCRAKIKYLFHIYRMLW